MKISELSHRTILWSSDPIYAFKADGEPYILRAFADGTIGIATRIVLGNSFRLYQGRALSKKTLSEGYLEETMERCLKLLLLT